MRKNNDLWIPEKECIQEIEYNMCDKCRFYDQETGECTANEDQIQKINDNYRKSSLNRFFSWLKDRRLSLRFMKPRKHKPFMFIKDLENSELLDNSSWNIYDILNKDHTFGITCGYCGKDMSKNKMDYEGMHGDPTCSNKCCNLLDSWIYDNMINRNGEIDKILEEINEEKKDEKHNSNILV